MGRPIVIAHRGASGYLPEHTRAAKIYAYASGADFLEQDVVSSRDGIPFVFHDIELQQVTDVALRFPGRARSDGSFYAIDFDAAELRRLRLCERRREDGSLVFPSRFGVSSMGFAPVSLDEELALVKELNRLTGRETGVYPEIKNPDWHLEHGIDLGELVVAALRHHGFDGTDAYIQCFDQKALQRLGRETSDFPLIQLLDRESSDNLVTQNDRGFSELAAYAAGIGPDLQDCWEVQTDEPTILLRKAQRHGLLVHPYTFRKDALPPGVQEFSDLLTVFFGKLAIDGVFCDQPDIAVEIRNRAIASG